MKTDNIQALQLAALSMLPSAVRRGKIEILPLREGGNNRLYRVETPDAKYVLKRYFRHPGDMRDRLDAEFTFATFAWRYGIRCIPRPVCRDDVAFCALYELVEGVPINSGDVGAGEINQAIKFFLDLNALRDLPDALKLSNASEACFSLQEHIELIESRLNRLRAIPASDDADRYCLEFVDGPLTIAWNYIRHRIEGTSEFSSDAPLPQYNRVISPSDFGYHNALRTEKGLIFLDFEYAGWDDPAKVVGDFFSQVAVPAPPDFFERFAGAVAGTVPTSAAMLWRIRLLRPLYRIKWCCIVLNHFLSIDADRRQFAQGAVLERKKEQLDKAEELLSSIKQFAIC